MMVLTCDPGGLINELYHEYAQIRCSRFLKFSGLLRRDCVFYDNSINPATFSLPPREASLTKLLLAGVCLGNVLVHPYTLILSVVRARQPKELLVLKRWRGLWGGSGAPLGGLWGAPGGSLGVPAVHTTSQKRQM